MASEPVQVPEGVDPVWYSMCKLRRRQYEDCTNLCTTLLAENNRDQAVWYLKCRSLSLNEYVDDTEMEEEGVAELLLDDNAVADAPRPGTSLNRPMTQQAGGVSQAIRPMSSSGRPLTGFARPGTTSRPMSGQVDVTTAMKGLRPGTSRPMTTLGREVRLGTASMASDPGGGVFINTDRLDFRKYAQRPALAMVLEDYLLYVERNPRKALELASESTIAEDYKDWWWKARLGKCYYKLGMLREAEKQLKSALGNQDMVSVHLELVKVYMRLDLPNTALNILMRAMELHPGESRLQIGVARLYELLNDSDKSTQHYKYALQLEANNVEAIACLAANHFYTDQPELALRYYRRLLQMGVNNTELWTNVGLCCFYASQYDMALGCLDRALAMASDDVMADVWYAVGQVAIGIGDLGLALQAFQIAISVDSNHAESYCNLGVLEMRKMQLESARSNFRQAQRVGPFLYEAFYNGALLAYKLGDFPEAFDSVKRALEIYPDHQDSKELQKLLQQHFAVL